MTDFPVYMYMHSHVISVFRGFGAVVQLKMSDPLMHTVIGAPACYL